MSAKDTEMILAEKDKYIQLKKANDVLVVGELPAFKLHKFKDLHKINSYEKSANTSVQLNA